MVTSGGGSMRFFPFLVEQSHTVWLSYNMHAVARFDTFFALVRGKKYTAK